MFIYNFSSELLSILFRFLGSRIDGLQIWTNSVKRTEQERTKEWNKFKQVELDEVLYGSSINQQCSIQKCLEGTKLLEGMLNPADTSFVKIFETKEL